MRFEIFGVLHAMLRESFLPNLRVRSQLPFHAKRKASLDQLKRLFQRNLRRWRQKKVKVVGHEHELVKQKTTLIAVPKQRIE